MIEIPTLRDHLTPQPSPFEATNYHGGGFVSDDDWVLIHSVFRVEENEEEDDDALTRSQSFSIKPNSEIVVDHSDEVDVGDYALRCGARRTIYWNPPEVTAAIVTVGDICPGVNDVVRSITYKLLDYGVPEGQILGIRYGFRGFSDREHKPVSLTRENMRDVHLDGGSILGTSHVRADINEIVKKLDLWKIDQLYVIAGAGGISAATDLHRACVSHKVPTSVVAIPKSIDNDVVMLDRTFGFQTAVEEAQAPLLAAKVEAFSGYRGIGIVKLMGKHAGFLAINASMASGLVDVCLPPEVPFVLEGPRGLYAYLEEVLRTQGHAVVCVAEGAGKDLVPPGEDVGPWLRSKLKKNIKDSDVKYIDPSYLIRSIAATSQDRISCRMLAHGAVHGAFAGYTGFGVGLVNSHHCYLPIEILRAVRTVDPKGDLWARLRSSNSQPEFTD